MSNSTKPMRKRALTAVGALALIGTAGAGVASTASAATTSNASSVLANIKYCESGGNYQAVNSSSGASGAYQFLNSTWQQFAGNSGYSSAAAAPASVQDAVALKLYNQLGTSPWSSSSSCWSSMTSAPASAANSTTTSTGSNTSTSSNAAAASSTSLSSTTATSGQHHQQPARGQHEVKTDLKPVGSVKGHDRMTKPEAKHAAHRHVGQHASVSNGDHAPKTGKANQHRPGHGAAAPQAPAPKAPTAA